MRKTWPGIVVVLLSLLSAAEPGSAQTNTTSANAVKLGVGQTALETWLDPTNIERWYSFYVVQGRSYCVEAVPASFEDTQTGTDDPNVTVYRSDGTTIVGSNGDSFVEPSLFWGARFCYIVAAPNVTGANFVKLRTEGTTPTVQIYYNARFVETTLYSNWFFVGGDYNAYTLLRNTTNTGVSYVVNYRSSAGALLATTSGALSGNGSAVLNARDYPGALAGVSGTVEIVHNSSPGSIFGSTTVLSSTSGLSFDAPFTMRTPW